MARPIVLLKGLAFDNLESFFGCCLQVGLLIGKLSVANSRDSVFSLIPTPAKDGEEAAKTTGAPSGQKDGSGKKGAKGKLSNVDSSSLLVDTDWVAEHARQVRSSCCFCNLQVLGSIKILSSLCKMEEIFGNSDNLRLIPFKSFSIEYW